MKVLLTGGTGFVGAHAIRALSERHDLTAITRRPPPPELEGLADWSEQDLSAGLDRSVLPERIDAVVHLAQSRRYRELPEGGPDVFAINVAATFELLEYSRLAGAKRFVSASSGGVYRRSDSPISEADPLEPPDLYFASKCAAERLVTGYAGQLGTVVLRPFFPYGPGQSEMMVARLIEGVTSGRELRVDGKPGLRMNPVWVGDMVDAIAAALEQDGSGVFNVAGPEAVSITELIELIADVSGREAKLTHEGEGSLGDLVGDTRLLDSQLGISLRTGLREGLAETVAAAASPADGRA